MDITEVPEGRTRSKFLAVGFADSTCRVLSLDVDSCLQKISLLALQSPPESISLMSQDHLYVGLANGVLVRSLVDNITGSVTDTR
jgi:splicing factor 3B subunit 3